jgi:hypothetical protein
MKLFAILAVGVITTTQLFRVSHTGPKNHRRFIGKGDANPRPDEYRVAYSDIVGVVTPKP